MKNGMIKYENGNHGWYLNGLRHRADGPAVELANGTRSWYLNDKLHRTDGPAIEWVNGTCWWYLDGKQYTFTEWLEHNPTLDDRKRLVYMLQYSDRAVV